MQAIEDIYVLLEEAERRSYNPDTFYREIQTVCEPIDVSLNKATQLSRYGYEIQPGCRNKKTGLVFTAAQGPDRPTFSRRGGHSSVLLEMGEQEGYEAIVSIGPYSIEYATSTDAHQYLTAEVNNSISGVPHLSYLSADDCAALLGEFFNPRLDNYVENSNQHSLEDF